MSQVVVVLGSKSDQKIVEESQMASVFEAVGVSYEVAIISAHRNLQELADYCFQTRDKGTLVYIGVAGMAATLPGAIASLVRERPVIGVPLSSEILQGLDALLSMVRMPRDIPVAVAGLDKAGLSNAAILACQIIAQSEPEIKNRLRDFLESNRKEAEYNITLGGKE